MLTEESIEAGLKAKLRSLNEYAWDGKFEWGEVENWLDNFNDEHEKTQMLYLLSQFIFIGNREMKELIRHIYRDIFKYKLVKTIRRNNEDTKDINFIESELKKQLSTTRFLGMGNPSESGTHLLYYFRQENNLPKSLFINSHEITKRVGGSIEIRDPDVNHYVFIDDLCGSGNQASNYSEELVTEIKEMKPKAVVSYYVLFGMTAGINEVRDNTAFDFVECAYELDESFKCFSENSRYYKNSPALINKNISEAICRKYGESLCVQHPLGYEQCQLLLGLFHNTPDNSLPIIWSSDNNWTPIFRRYPKIYDWGS